MSKRKRSRTPKVHYALSADYSEADLRAAMAKQGEAQFRRQMGGYTVRRNAAGLLVARRSDGVEFVGPVTL